MKTWWEQLALREKQMVSLGALLVGAFLIYEILFSPLSSATHNERQKVKSNQALLAWMQENDKRISAINHTETKNTTPSSLSLLSLIQLEINNHAFDKNVTELKQVDTDSVQLTLQKINFDAFIQWLTTISTQHHFIVSDMTIQPTETPGITNITLKSTR